MHEYFSFSHRRRDFFPPRRTIGSLRLRNDILQPVGHRKMVVGWWLWINTLNRYDNVDHLDALVSSTRHDLEATTPDSYRRRTLGLRRKRYNSSESIESLFSYQFSQMITLAR
ncbi:Uncharacterized protein Fot_09702 [Forsythia ovata]|uniref:Uncharacterized protein n=1 Tax=Forsythia ovata TaxID=205694 RepID=A0ABD1WER7_9LAMI